MNFPSKSKASVLRSRRLSLCHDVEEFSNPMLCIESLPVGMVFQRDCQPLQYLPLHFWISIITYSADRCCASPCCDNHLSLDSVLAWRAVCYRAIVIDYERDYEQIRDVSGPRSLTFPCRPRNGKRGFLHRSNW